MPHFVPAMFTPQRCGLKVSDMTDWLESWRGGACDRSILCLLYRQRSWPHGMGFQLL